VHVSERHLADHLRLSAYSRPPALLRMSSADGAAAALCPDDDAGFEQAVPGIPRAYQ
jgi:hypothetical protein